MSERMKMLLFFSVLSCSIGLILLLGSAHFGVSRSDSWLEGYTDSIDFEIYVARTQAYINSFQIIGSIFLAGGLYAIIGAILKTVNLQK